jgi:hypothetical protein
MMKRNVWTGTCAAIVSLAAAGVLAQTPAQPPTPRQDTPSSSDKKITVTGCLKAAPSMATDTASAASPNPTGAVGTAGSTTPEAAGTTGTSATRPTTATPATDAKFILTAATASAGEAATGATAATTAQTYRLIANPSALTEHVGKKLELTGTIDPTSTADPKDPSAAAPAFRVESGKIVAATCSE